jgi:hypothetical protein
MGESSQQPGERLIEQIAGQISRWKLTAPAILFLEAAKPLSFIAGQGLLLSEPLLSFLYHEPRVSEIADLLADRSNVEHLIAHLEWERANHGQGNVGEESWRNSV